MKLRLEGRWLLEISVGIGVVSFFSGCKQASKQSSLFDVTEGRHADG